MGNGGTWSTFGGRIAEGGNPTVPGGMKTAGMMGGTPEGVFLLSL